MDLTAARREVGWFYASSASAMGLHGQSYEPGASSTWDEARCARAHASLLSFDHRADVNRYEKLLVTILRVPVELRRDLESVYVPFGASRTTWQAYCCFTKEDRPLLGLALRTPEMARAYARRKSSISAPTFTGLLRFVEDEVAHLDHRTIRPGHALPRAHRLEPALVAANAREIAAVEAYESFRATRVREETRARQAWVDEQLTALHRRLWGVP